MSQELEQLCKDYLADNLPPRRRKRVEQRIANGDAELISTINRLRSFQTPSDGTRHQPKLSDDDPSLLGAFMSQEAETVHSKASIESTEQKPDNSDQVDPNTKRVPDKEQTNNLADKENHQPKTRILQIAGGVIIILLLFFIYYQWQNQLLERNLNIQTDQLEKVSEKLETMQRRDRRSDRQFELLKTIIRSELFEHIRLDGEHENWKSGIMVWDRSTLRTGWLINKAKLSGNQAFFIWTADKDNKWQYAGSIDRVIRDSLYTTWNNTAFNQARRLEIRIDTLNALPEQQGHTHGELITRITMPR